MPQERIRSAPLKPEQKLPNSKLSETKESRVRSYEEDRNITCYLLIADLLIVSGDFKNADRYFKKAADLGNLYAQNELSYEDATELHNYPKNIPLTPVFFANHCVKSAKTPSPRMYWMLARLYERSPGGAGLSKAEEYYEKASASGYLRAYIDLNQSNELLGPKSHQEIREHYNEVIKIDNAHILFLSGPFFDTRHKVLIASTMGPMFNAEFATQFVKSQYKGLFYEMAAERGYPRAHFELGKYHKNKPEKDLFKAYDHLKEAQNGLERLLEILKSDKEILQSPAFFDNNRRLFFQKDKEYIESELNALQTLISQQPVAMPQDLAVSIASNQQPSAAKKTKSAIRRGRLKRKAGKKKSSDAVTPPVVPQDTTNAESKNAISKANELEKLPSVDASEQVARHQKNCVDITITPVVPAEKKSISPAEKEELSVAKKASAASAITSIELPESQSAINPEQKKEKATSNKNSKAKNSAANNSVAAAHQNPAKKNKKSINNASQEQTLITTTPSTAASGTAASAVVSAGKKSTPAVSIATKANHKIKDAIASNPPTVTSQGLDPKKSNQAPTAPNIVGVTKSVSPPAKKAAPPTAETKQTIPKANPKSESVVVNNSSTTAKQNTNQRLKTPTNASNKAAINTASRSVSATSSASISNRPINYPNSSTRNNSPLIAALTTERKTAITTPPAKTSPAPKQEGKMSYADLFKKLAPPTTSSAARSSAAQPVSVAPGLAPANSESDKNLVVAPDLTAVNSVNREEPATAPMLAQQQPSVVVPPQASFTYPTSANFAADYQYGQIPQASVPSVPVMPIFATAVDPIILATLDSAFQNGYASMIRAINASFSAGQYHALAAVWGASSAHMVQPTLGVHEASVVPPLPISSSIALGEAAAAVGHFAATASHHAPTAPSSASAHNFQGNLADNPSNGPAV